MLHFQLKQKWELQKQLNIYFNQKETVSKGAVSFS
jgi:hypothetical protein